MNSSEITRRSNQRFFFTSLVIAIGLTVASGFFVKGMFGGNSGDTTTSTNLCLSVMRTNGFAPKQHGHEMSVEMRKERGIESLVYQSGVIIASCPAYTLKDYCAGAGCKTPGISFTLVKKEP